MTRVIIDVAWRPKAIPARSCGMPLLQSVLVTDCRLPAVMATRDWVVSASTKISASSRTMDTRCSMTSPAAIYAATRVGGNWIVTGLHDVARLVGNLGSVP